MEGFFRNYLRLYRPILSELNKLLGRQGLSYSLWQVMVYVHDRGSSTLVDISSHYSVEKPVITRSVQRLEEQGLMACEPSQDRRVKRIALTPRGLEVYRVCRREITALEKLIMAEVTEDEQRLLARLLPCIRDRILSLDGGAGND